MSILRNSILFVVKDVGHNPFLENPEELEEREEAHADPEKPEERGG